MVWRVALVVLLALLLVWPVGAQYDGPLADEEILTEELGMESGETEMEMEPDVEDPADALPMIVPTPTRTPRPSATPRVPTATRTPFPTITSRPTSTPRGPTATATRQGGTVRGACQG